MIRDDGGLSDRSEILLRKPSELVVEYSVGQRRAGHHIPTQRGLHGRRDL